VAATTFRIIAVVVRRVVRDTGVREKKLERVERATRERGIMITLRKEQDQYWDQQEHRRTPTRS
jgi:hypothetical protein